MEELGYIVCASRKRSKARAAVKVYILDESKDNGRAQAVYPDDTIQSVLLFCVDSFAFVSIDKQWTRVYKKTHKSTVTVLKKDMCLSQYQWAFENGCEKRLLLKLAAGQGNMEAVRYLNGNNAIWNLDMMEAAYVTGQYEMLRFILETRKKLVDFALRSDLDVLRVRSITEENIECLDIIIQMDDLQGYTFAVVLHYITQRQRPSLSLVHWYNEHRRRLSR